jgi:Tfp pilus assembly protein PilF
MLCCVQGNADGAKADFRQVVALEPQNKQAREELRSIEAMEEQLQPGAF